MIFIKEKDILLIYILVQKKKQIMDKDVFYKGKKCNGYKW